MTLSSVLKTVRDLRAALAPFPDVPLATACAMLATRALDATDNATALDTNERERFQRLLALFRSASNHTGAGYVGIRWTTIRIGELGGRTAIEALQTQAGTDTVMAFLKRRQAATLHG